MHTSEDTVVEARSHLVELLTRSATGDHVAFAEFYDLTASRIYAIVRRCLIDHAQSEEVVQDIYLEVWQNLRKYEPTKGSAFGWIAVIAHRRAVDRVRSSQASRQRDLSVGIRDRPIEFDSVSESAAVRIDHQLAVRALDALTALQREAVSLAYFDGLSHTEIAGRLGLSVSTVKTRLRDGLIRMRKQLTPAEISLPA